MTTDWTTEARGTGAYADVNGISLSYAIYPDMLAQQGQVSAAAVDFMRDTPMYQLYQRVAPRPEDFGRLLDMIGAAMAQDFDFSEQVRGLRVPTLFACADPLLDLHVPAPR